MNLTNLVKRFSKNTQGVTAIEYAIVGVAVAAVVAAVFSGSGGDFQGALEGAFTKITTSISGAG